ncbi:homeobox-leucine zipper protein HAT3-like [Olea europaea var. sylvestris]|uniref:homeobox-leucine zipper protein HAT3-like n=1 Tax=Olea europaea var. sylvestris TaxID=158386 RepID=UPI000C1D6F3F|nr:homeobox-leucine zipper protein HAT3-like [Olea europaea var. sylvestris]
MAGKDDELGLSLSLSLRCPDNKNPDPPTPNFPLNLMRSSLPFMHHHNYGNDPLKSPADCIAEPRSFLRGIDVNRPVTVVDCEEEVMASSPNSTLSSLSGKRNEREENDGERATSSLEEEDGGEAARKKLRLSKEQAAVLEETFKEHNTLSPKQKLALAKELNLRPRQVEVWFQNRRARTKLKQTEVDCDYLRRRCENLTEENRRLQKEVNELRALKLSPHFYMNTNPPTTLTMCPQCERVAVSSSSSSAAGAGITRQHNPAIEISVSKQGQNGNRFSPGFAI